MNILAISDTLHVHEGGTERRRMVNVTDRNTHLDLFVPAMFLCPALLFKIYK